MNKIKIGISGCLGRMGRELVREVLSNAEIEFAGGFENPSNDMGNEFMIPLPDNFKSNALDSLSYRLAYLLYFDLNSVDSAIVEFKDIIKKFPESDFALKSLIILDLEEPDSNWTERINDVFPNSIYVSNTEPDALEKKRNQAWDLLSESYNETNKFCYL